MCEPGGGSRPLAGALVHQRPSTALAEGSRLRECGLGLHFEGLMWIEWIEKGRLSRASRTWQRFPFHQRCFEAK